MKKEFVVTADDTAEKLGSGLLPVLATPRLVAMIENASYLACADELDEGESTVGVNMNIEHLLPSVVGATITVETTLMNAGKKSFSFKFEARSGEQLIAKGLHVRVRVNSAAFMAKLEK